MKCIKRMNWKRLIWSFIAVYSAVIIGSLLTSPAVNSSWYQSIKPSITPPNFVFPIAWNILFFLMFVSLYLSLTFAKKKELKLKIAVAFGINLFLNVLWSFFYFFLRKPNFAFFDIILLEISIISLIFVSSRANRKIAWLLVPYALWVLFAGVLNYLSAFR